MIGSIPQDKLRITERVEKTGVEDAQSTPGGSRSTATSVASEKPVVILIVDDNAAIRRFMRRAISGPNREIHECADGVEALELYPKILPDLTLMDIRMPGMDGLTATKAILGKSPGAKIVIVTDYDIEEIKVAALAAGARGYVLKDNLADVEAVVSRLMK
ncbi:MAG: response regulator transcription factor [Edaphobacter sp.]